MVSLTHEYVRSHREQIETALAGPISFLTIVPSKKAGIDYATQPLRMALSRVAAIESELRETLSYVPNITIARQTYHPEAFTAIGSHIEGSRIVIIEDTWVTGATCLSAAGALLREGAAATIILPIARLINSAFWSEDHPYRQGMMDGSYDPIAPSSWPR